MRLLADENFPKPAVEWLREQGHDVIWARTHHPGWTDLQLLELAETDERIVLTLDKDFWQIALQRREPLRLSGVVHFKAHPAIVGEILPLLRAFVTARLVWSGRVSRISRDGIQMFGG